MLVFKDVKGKNKEPFWRFEVNCKFHFLQSDVTFLHLKQMTSSNVINLLNLCTFLFVCLFVFCFCFLFLFFVGFFFVLLFFFFFFFAEHIGLCSQWFCCNIPAQWQQKMKVHCCELVQKKNKKKNLSRKRINPICTFKIVKLIIYMIVNSKVNNKQLNTLSWGFCMKYKTLSLRGCQ